MTRSDDSRIQDLDGIRLPLNEVADYSARYAYAAEETVRELVPPVRERGFLTKDDLMTVGRWKSARILSRLNQNPEPVIREVTMMALNTRDLRLAVHIPQSLVGVGMPVASTILHWFHEDQFPILDFRALWSLGWEAPSAYTLEFWQRYVEATRSLANQCTVDMRTLDRALWQYSKEHQLVS